MAQHTQKKSLPRKSAKGVTSIAELLRVVREAKDAYQALGSINCKFSEEERKIVVLLVRHAKRHAELVATGGKPEHSSLARTISLANRAAASFDGRFEAIMRDSFLQFDKVMQTVRAAAPQFLIRDTDHIVSLQDGLRKQLANNLATYDDTIEAYKAMMDYLPTVSKEAGDQLDAIRAEQRRERNASLAREILAELDDLDVN